MSSTAPSLVPLILLAVGVLACAGPPPVALPELDTTDMEAPVAARLAAMHRAVREDGKPAMWGRLGMVYQAHALYTEALHCYGPALVGDAGSYRWPYLAALAQRDADPAAALVHFEAAAVLAPENAGFFVQFGDALSELGEPERAAEQYRAALELDPDSSHALLGLGRLAFGRGDAEVALEQLDKAVRIAPNHGEVHALLAQVYTRRGDRQRAELSELRARAWPDPSRPRDPVIEEMEATAVNSRSYTRRGLRLAREERWEEAERAFRRVLEIRPGNVQDYANLGGVLTRQGHVEEALEAYGEGLRVDENDPGAHNNLGLALLGSGDVEGAVEHLQKAIDLDPSHAEAYYNLGLVRFREKHFNAAADHYGEALRLRPWFVDAHRDLGNAQAARGDLAAAVTSWRRAVEIDPQRVPVLYNLGAALARLGEHGEAVDRLETALALAPNSSRLATLLAWQLAAAPDEKLRDAPRALELARRVRDAYPDQPDSLDVLAVALAATGNFAAAERAARQGVELARGMGQARRAAEIESRRVLYERGRPYRFVAD